VGHGEQWTGRNISFHFADRNRNHANACNWNVIRCPWGWRVAQASEFLLPIPELWVPRPCVFCKGGHDGRVAQASEFLLPIPELWVPRPCVFCKGGYDAADSMGFVMPVVAVNVGWGRFPFAIVWHKEHSLFSSRDTRYAKSGAPTIVIPSAAKRLGHPRFPVFLEK
jgi:hypothetical protein